MLDIYTRNLLKKNISMLEFIDFMDTYKSTKQMVLTAQKQVGVLFEELECAVGTTLK
jgi:cobalt-zinc-cadmium efflux system outer membrane protein